MDLTAAQCGAYEVWGRIGEGGMSRVWLAKHRELGTPVVLKTLLDGPEDALARLRFEARMTARIPSPRVVRAVDVGEGYVADARRLGRTEEEAKRSAWQSFCQMLLCSNEFLYVD